MWIVDTNHVSFECPGPSFSGHAFSVAPLTFCTKSHTDPKLSLLQCTHHVVSGLLFSDSDTSEHKAKSECVLRMIGKHFPSAIQPEPNSTQARPTRHCCVCFKEQKQVESRY